MRRSTKSSAASAGALIDIAIVVVLALSAVVVLRVRASQQRFDSVVDAALVPLRAADAHEVALPWSLRRAVPRLLAQSVQPTLFAPATLSAQGLVRAGVRYVLAVDDATNHALGAATARRLSLPGAALIELDEQRALELPLQVAQTITWVDVRPYRYRPLRDSFVLESGSPVEYEALLEPGAYEFAVEAFARNGGTMTISDDLGQQHSTTSALDVIVYDPLVYTFELTGATRSVRITMRADIDAGRYPTRCLVHKIELERKR